MAEPLAYSTDSTERVNTLRKCSMMLAAPFVSSAAEAMRGGTWTGQRKPGRQASQPQSSQQAFRSPSLPALSRHGGVWYVPLAGRR